MAQSGSIWYETVIVVSTTSVRRSVQLRQNAAMNSAAYQVMSQIRAESGDWSILTQS